MPLPTDNLYKFMAIAGLALLGYSGVYVAREARNVNLEFFDATRERDLLNLELERLEKRVEARQKAEKVANDFAEKSEDFKKALESHKAQALEDPEFQDIVQQFYLIESKQTEVNNKIKKTNYLLRTFRYLRVLGFMGVIGGLILAGVGFLNWYWKIQIYQDRSMKRGSA